MYTISVFIENWEIECCGVPPAVGHSATWSLAFEEDDSGPARDLPPDATWSEGLLTFGGVTASWPNPANKPPDQARGYFFGTGHGGGVLPIDVAPTTGTVTALQLEIMEYREVAPKNWEPIEHTRLLRPIVKSPSSFKHDLENSHCIETGVLMELDVAR
ncbi:DUF6578 domain-containing protein [Rhodococcus sp. P1Y]|uniref:DUF6578 domain-containing protein n=1 Tax=Rhodococcus sp. P1Y TaxID=1302308 RepID=UPI000EAD3124|nr:DUF6578 domain-containing protein [Rhodococcus sp. P1Y]AYJ47989.1 hypothetical protein D8W71_06175 [Rhodococcus sp. P1Y]